MLLYRKDLKQKSKNCKKPIGTLWGLVAQIKLYSSVGLLILTWWWRITDRSLLEINEYEECRLMKSHQKLSVTLGRLSSREYFSEFTDVSCLFLNLAKSYIIMVRSETKTLIQHSNGSLQSGRPFNQYDCDVVVRTVLSEDELIKRTKLKTTFSSLLVLQFKHYISFQESSSS